VLGRELNYAMAPKQVLLYKVRNFALNDRVAELSLKGPKDWTLLDVCDLWASKLGELMVVHMSRI
jgi:hypothetical protein